MPYCNKCGTKLRPQAKFCHICGNRVPIERLKQFSQRSPQYQQYQPPVATSAAPLDSTQTPTNVPTIEDVSLSNDMQLQAMPAFQTTEEKAITLSDIEALDEELTSLKTEMEQLKELETELRELKKEYSLLEEQLLKIHSIRQKEERDVKKLKSWNWKSIQLRFKGKFDEALRKEQEEYLKALAEEEHVQKELQRVQKQIKELEGRIQALKSLEPRYNSLLDTYNRYLRQLTKHLETDNLAKLEKKQQELATKISKLNRKIEMTRYGRIQLTKAINLLKEARGFLTGARGAATWDLLGGGFISDMVERGYLSKAQNKVQQADRILRELRTKFTALPELNVQINMPSLLFDTFLDNIFTDYARYNKISKTIQQLDEIIRQLNTILQYRLSENVENNLTKELNDLKIAHKHLLSQLIRERKKLVASKTIEKATFDLKEDIVSTPITTEAITSSDISLEPKKKEPTLETPTVQPQKQPSTKPESLTSIPVPSVPQPTPIDTSATESEEKQEPSTTTISQKPTTVAPEQKTTTAPQVTTPTSPPPKTQKTLPSSFAETFEKQRYKFATFSISGATVTTKFHSGIFEQIIWTYNDSDHTFHVTLQGPEHAKNIDFSLSKDQNTEYDWLHPFNGLELIIKPPELTNKLLSETRFAELFHKISGTVKISLKTQPTIQGTIIFPASPENILTVIDLIDQLSWIFSFTFS